MQVCLIAIVKNEAAEIVAMIDSVAGHVTRWSIVDTGSTDGTQQIIIDHMAKLAIPGVLHERPWNGFGPARDECYRLAEEQLTRDDWMLLVDADDRITWGESFSWAQVENVQHACVGFGMRVTHGAMSQVRPHLFRAHVGWRYLGVVHEYATCPDGGDICVLQDAVYVSGETRAQEQADVRARYLRDAALLRAELDKTPDDPRSQFYYAQSLFCAADRPEEALRAYEVRAANETGWAEERWHAAYRCATIMLQLERPLADVVSATLRAWAMRPSRAEPMFQLAHALRGRPEAYPFAVAAASLPRPSDTLFVEDEVYAWRAVDEAMVAASAAHNPSIANAFAKSLLGRAPETERERIEKNMQYFTECGAR